MHINPETGTRKEVRKIQIVTEPIYNSNSRGWNDGAGNGSGSGWGDGEGLGCGYGRGWGVATGAGLGFSSGI